MNRKLLGGILVITLIVKPSIFTVEILAYEMFRANKQAIQIMQKKDDEYEKTLKEVDSIDVDRIIFNIENNANNIKNLLQEKNKVVSNVQALMDLRSYEKTNLSELQITAFQEFTSCYQQEVVKLEATLNSLQETDFLLVRNEILKTESDYNIILSELQVISEKQYEVIYSLNSIIDAGNEVIG